MKVGVGSASRAGYSLWECDLTETVCSIVHTEIIPPIFLVEDYQTSTATLEITDTQHIKMIINARGEVITLDYTPQEE